MHHEIEYLDAEKIKSSGVTLKQLENIEEASKQLYSKDVVRHDLPFAALLPLTAFRGGFLGRRTLCKYCFKLYDH